MKNKLLLLVSILLPLISNRSRRYPRLPYSKPDREESYLRRIDQTVSDGSEE